jgi:hypothetical protein
MNETKRSTAAAVIGFFVGIAVLLVMASCNDSGEITQPQGDYPMDSGCYGSTR